MVLLNSGKVVQLLLGTHYLPIWKLLGSRTLSLPSGRLPICRSDGTFALQPSNLVLPHSTALHLSTAVLLHTIAQ